MKRGALVVTVAALMAGTSISFGQGHGMNPFFDRSDTGEIVHVLPPEASIHSPHDTQPTFATVRWIAPVIPSGISRQHTRQPCRPAPHQPRVDGTSTKWHAARVIARQRVTEEAQEGFRAFVEKRKPAWAPEE